MLRLRDESGTVMVEYALVLALLSLAFITGLEAVERATSTVLNSTQNNMLNQYDLRLGNTT